MAGIVQFSALNFEHWDLPFEDRQCISPGLFHHLQSQLA